MSVCTERNQSNGQRHAAKCPHHEGIEQLTNLFFYDI